MRERLLVVQFLFVLSVFISSLGTSVAGAKGSEIPPLVEATKAQDIQAVLTLLDEGAEIDQKQPDGATSLHWAVYRDNFNILEVLLAAGANADAVNRLGASPLWLAAQNGNAEILARLLDVGADPNVSLRKGETPLMAAARSGSAKGIRLLLESGAYVDAREETRDQTALMWAVSRGDDTAVEILLEFGADPNTRSRVRPTLVYSDGVNAGVFDQGVIEQLGGFTPLLFAARHGDVGTARVLLASGARIDAVAPNGASPLVIAMHSGHTEFVKFLLDEGADPNANQAGYTALHAAVLRGEIEACRELLNYGADPNVRLERGTPVRRASQDWTLRPAYASATPFWLAAAYREPEVMQLLVDNGANPLLSTTERWSRVRDRAGGVGPPQLVGGYVTPIMAAVRGASDRGRNFIIANPDPTREERRALESVRIATEFGGDVNASDETGATALHDAASRNLTTVVRFLGEQGAVLDAKNKAGYTALDLAAAGSRRGRGVTGLGPDWSVRPNTVDLLRELAEAKE